jgi:hypothetical protein
MPVFLAEVGIFVVGRRSLSAYNPTVEDGVPGPCSLIGIVSRYFCQRYPDFKFLRFLRYRRCCKVFIKKSGLSG